MKVFLYKLRKNWLSIAIILSTVLICSWTIFTRSMFYTHDYLHGARIGEMTRGLLEGQWPVIWSGNFGWGYGMPIFEFYAPWPYFLGAIIHLLGVNLVWCTKILFLLVNVVTLLGTYLWAREWFDREISSLAASLATLASYRAMDLFARGAMSELWAIAALPWLFCGLSRLIRNEKNAWSITIFSGVVIILSHNITTLLVAPVLLLYILALLIFDDRYQRDLRRILTRLLGAGVLISALTAFYLFPAFFEKDYTQVKTWILSDYFNFRLHFLYFRQFFCDNFGYGGSGWGPNDGLSFFLGWAQWLGLAVTVGVMVAVLFDKKQNRQKLRQVALFSCIFVIFLFTLFMTMTKSQFIWETFASLLSFAQFPWRYLGISVILLSLLSVAGLTFFPPKRQPSLIVTLWLIAILTSTHYFQGEKYLDEPAFYQDDPEFIRQEMSQILVDYLPIDFANEWAAVSLKQMVTAGEQPEILVDRMSEKLLQFSGEASREAELTIAYYPGWSAENNGQSVPIRVSERGNIVVDIPAGKEVKVGVFLRDTPLRAFCNWLSALAWTGLIVVGLSKKWKIDKK